MDTYSRLLDDVDGGEVGLPEIRFHDLRHTCATLLITKGVHPKIVSEMLWRLGVSDHAGYLLPRDTRAGGGRWYRDGGGARRISGR
jgi:hypothetical protein